MIFFLGGRLIIFQRLRISEGIKIIPSELSFLSAPVFDNFQELGVIFFYEDDSVFLRISY